MWNSTGCQVGKSQFYLYLLIATAWVRPIHADVVDPPPVVNVDSFFFGNSAFQDNAFIGNGGIHEMKAIQVGSQVYAYYRTYAGLPYDNCNGRGGAIGLAISNDGGASFQPYNDGHPIVAMGSYGEWDDCYVVAPSVARGPDGRYYMAYEGVRHDGYKAGDIGLAISNDGINWTKQGVLLSHGGGWEKFNIGTPSIHYFSGTWYVFYHGDDGHGRECRGFASGPNLGSLAKHGDPAICPTNGAWDSAVIGRGDVYYDGSSYYMVYEGNSYDGNGGAWGWGIAKSQDLINWTKYPGNPIRQSPSGFSADIPTWFVTPKYVYVYFRAVNAGNTTERDLLSRVNGLPGGSYTASCTQCSDSGRILSCGCLNEAGQYVATLLNESACLPGVDISNQDGQLTCATNNPTAAIPTITSTLPSGSYAQTCSACSRSGSVLRCNCMNMAGQSVKTSLDSSACAAGVDLWNNNGALTCTTHNPVAAIPAIASTLPSGSYAQTCSACSLSGSILTCSCANMTGQNITTSLDGSACSIIGDISNNDGSLTCPAS